MKKIISLVFSILLLCSFSAPCLAVESDDNSYITQFSYVVFDADGNVKNTGITPDFNARYSWDGITLENGEQVIFRKTDGTNFYALRGTSVEYEVSKDRIGYVTMEFLNAVDGTASSGLVLNSSQVYALRGVINFTIPETPCIVNSYYYYLTVKNATSDPMNITGVSLSF